MHWKHSGRKSIPFAGLTAADQFKTYEQLQNRLQMVLGQKSPSRPRLDEEVENEETDRGSFTPNFESSKLSCCCSSCL